MFFFPSPFPSSLPPPREDRSSVPPIRRQFPLSQSFPPCTVIPPAFSLIQTGFFVRVLPFSLRIKSVFSFSLLGASLFVLFRPSIQKSHLPLPQGPFQFFFLCHDSLPFPSTLSSFSVVVVLFLGCPPEVTHQSLFFFIVVGFFDGLFSLFPGPQRGTHLRLMRKGVPPTLEFIPPRSLYPLPAGF